MKDQLKTIREALESVMDTADWGTSQKAITALDQIETMVEAQQPVAWVYNRVDSTCNPFFMKAGHEADYLRVGRPPLLNPSSAHVDWTPLYTAAPVAQQPQKLEDVEQYRMRMAGICTAAIGYWKEGDSIHPDYDTPALRDVAKLYAKYDALYKAQQAEAVPPTHVLVPVEPTEDMLKAAQGDLKMPGPILNIWRGSRIKDYRAMLAAAPKGQP